MLGHRILLLTGAVDHTVEKGIDEINRRIPGLEWLVLMHAPRKPVGLLLRNQWKNARFHGWRWIPYQAGDMGARLWRRARPAKQQAWRGRDYSLDAPGRAAPLRVLRVDDLYAEQTLQTVRDFAPALGLALAAPILKRALFGIPELGTLNLHKGRVPDYRGMPPAFWEMWNGEATAGCTVHWVDDKLDTGDIVASRALAIEPYATVRGLRLRLDELGIDLTCEAVAEALDGRAQAQPQPAGGKTYRKPTLAQDAGLQRALLRRQAPDQPLLRRVLKDGVTTTMHAAWQAGLGRLLAPRLTCLLYHRVSDAVRDNLTVGIEQFDRQMALLRRHCDVVSVEEAMAMAQVPRSGRPLVCVSFDDGYLDNYTNAAQILLRHQIPAAFFVTTGLIGTERAFPHDVRRGNPPIPMMEWEQVRSMRDCGFTIGSHSVHHIDCAAEPEDVVWRELVDSRDTLRRELGLDGMLFAYPYGKRQNMTPERLELVKRAGYGGCLSAYGGANTGAVDRWNLMRRGIHWEFSDSAFLYACLGL